MNVMIFLGGIVVGVMFVAVIRLLTEWLIAKMEKRP